MWRQCIDVKTKLNFQAMDGPGMDDLGFFWDLGFSVLFNSNSVISDDHWVIIGRLCTMEPRLRLERIPPQAGHITYWEPR